MSSELSYDDICQIGTWYLMNKCCFDQSENQKKIDMKKKLYIDGLVQDCSNSIANALEFLQSCTKP